MADAPNFAKLVPGFDFLQTLVKNAGSALPSIGQWVAPTLNPDELEKRIEELRTVQFWLEQNARMLGATIQALEVQRMTLSTLEDDERADGRPARIADDPPARQRPAATDPAAIGCGAGARPRSGASAAPPAKKPVPREARTGSRSQGCRARRHRPDAMVGRADQAVHAARRRRR